MKRLYCRWRKGNGKARTLPFCQTVKTELSKTLSKDDYIFLLDSCINSRSLAQGQQIHAHLLVTGLHAEHSTLVGKIVAMYTLCGQIRLAEFALQNAVAPVSAFAYNMLIRFYACTGPFQRALDWYEEMRRNRGVFPDKFTFPFLAKACAALQDLHQGQNVYRHARKARLDSNSVVANSFVFMFSKCCRPDLARQVFEKMPGKTLVSWNSMVAAYVENGYLDKAFEILEVMRDAGVCPDRVTVLSLLSGCGEFGDRNVGFVHDWAVEHGLDSDVTVGNALIDAYCKGGRLGDARQVFDQMRSRDVVSWTAMISGLVQSRMEIQAFRMFSDMQQQSEIEPNSFTIAGLLPAFGRSGMISQGQSVHALVLKKGFDADIVIRTALIDMYAKCRDMCEARKLLAEKREKNKASWNCMICGCSDNGQFIESLMVLKQMVIARVSPDVVSVVGALRACAHLKSLQQGKSIHGFCFRHGFHKENVSVPTALINMYAKCWSLGDAAKIFDRMTDKDLLAWSTMISAYATHGRGRDALAVFNRMLTSSGLRPNGSVFSSVLNACSRSGLVKEGRRCFRSMINEFNIVPGLEHYACMVDLYGRSGNLVQAEQFIKEKMHLEPTVEIWATLLSCCRIHCNVEVGQRAAAQLFNREPKNPRHYVLMCEIYSAAGNQDGVEGIRKMMQEEELEIISH